MADQIEDNARLRAGQLDGFIGYNLKRANLLVQGATRRVLEPHDLTPSAFATLSLVMSHPGITQSEVARQLGIERSGLVALVDKLQGRGFVKREPVPGDRRVQALHPTSAGCAAYDVVLRDIRDLEDRMFKDFSEQERGALLSILGKLRTGLEEE